MSDIASRVKRIINEVIAADLSLVTDEASLLDDLGADSLDTVELVMALEEEFGIEISDYEMEEVKTVADCIRVVESRVNGRAMA